MREPVRHLSSANVPRVAVGAFEKNVEVWDISTSACVGAFSTVLDFGGKRLCLSADGRRCFAGAYRRAGVVGYNVDDGQVLWSRPDIKRVQYISRSSGGELFVGVAEGPALLLSASDGKTLEKLRGVEQVFEASAGTARVLDRNRPVLELKSGRSFEVKRTTFAILDVAFGPSTVCISEAAGPTRCLDLEDGRELWRYQPPQGEHVLSVTYCPSVSTFLGISIEYERTLKQTVLHLGPGDLFSEITALGRPAVARFCLSGEAVILDDGRMIDTATGRLIRIVPFAEGPTSTTLDG